MKSFPRWDFKGEERIRKLGDKLLASNKLLANYYTLNQMILIVDLSSE